LTSWFVEAAIAEPAAPPRRAKPKPKPQSKPKPKPQSKPAAGRKRAARARSARSGIAWIAVGGILLAGVVFVNVAVLRLNLSLDKATQQRTRLHAENARLNSQLSSELASPRIQAIARQNGLVAADPSTIGYVKLGR
jgi:cell division protein FtsL